ncbi:MAG: 23S rRNA (adenine(2503)-C(2))-methyltransferase RlmN [Desulfobacterales bacterium]|nr:23S rRNA (adenine(2503)-C(2))-methyltransferase RlmN [Desulfobacterales bacterium]
MMTPKNQQDIKQFTRHDLSVWLAEHNIKPYRADQILKWVYLRQLDDFSLMTDIHKSLRLTLNDHFIIQRLKKQKITISSDNTQKYLFQLDDGHHIESVLIPEKNHYTLCVSTQVGCAQGCLFCRTAQLGFIRNLRVDEIIGQVRDIVFEHNTTERKVSNIVFMGMGEPFANYNNLIKSLSIITDTDYGLKFSQRKVTVSTVGLVPQIKRFSADSMVNLAISLNAWDNNTRNYIMPINQAYPIEYLLKECQIHAVATKQRVTFEYILIKGLNDSENDAKNLAKLLHPIKCKLNLIPFNEHNGSHFLRPSNDTIEKFQTILLNKDFTVIVRKSKGLDINAACGQLAASLS